MDLANLDFQQLRIKHIAYKSKVRSVLYGGSYDKRYFQEDNPVFLWFSDIGNVRYGGEPWLQQLSRQHRDFSVLADGLIKKYGSDLIEQAHDGLEDLNAASERFLRTLSKVEQQSV